MKRIFIITLMALVCVGGLAVGTNALGNGAVIEKTALNTPLQEDFDSLNAEVTNLMERINLTKPTGTAGEQRGIFIMLDQEIDLLDNKIDLLESKAKVDYAAGILTWEQYGKIDRALDGLDNMLERAERQLEKTFGMDD